MNLDNLKYNKVTVDRLDVIKLLNRLDYKHLLKEYRAKYGKS